MANIDGQFTRPRWAPVLEGSAVAAFFVLASSLLVGVARAADTPERIALLLAAALAGYLAADFLSGCAHWFCDTFFDEQTPLLGPLLIAPFREHHHDPLAITRHGFLELNGNSALVLLPVLAATWLWSSPAGSAALFLHGMVTAGGLALFATNQFHRWAHEPQPPAVARWLQQRGWILAPEQHARHHRPPHAGAYCITAGWMNAPLDRLRFFPRCERMLRALRSRVSGTGFQPVHVPDGTLPKIPKRAG